MAASKILSEQERPGELVSLELTGPEGVDYQQSSFDTAFPYIQWMAIFIFCAGVVYFAVFRVILPSVCLMRSLPPGVTFWRLDAVQYRRRDRARQPVRTVHHYYRRDVEEHLLSIMLEYGMLVGAGSSGDNQGQTGDRVSNGVWNNGRWTRVTQTDQGDIFFEVWPRRKARARAPEGAGETGVTSYYSDVRSNSRVAVFSAKEPSVLQSFEPTANHANMNCAICLDALNIRRLAALPCLHPMHEDCFKSWVVRTTRLDCPLCAQSFIDFDPTEQLTAQNASSARRTL